jgi:hypothetical protein
MQNAILIVATLLFAAPMVATGVSYADGFTATTAVTVDGGQIHIPAAEVTTVPPVAGPQTGPEAPIAAESEPTPPAATTESQPPAEELPGEATQPPVPPVVDVPLPALDPPPADPAEPAPEEPAGP